MLEHLNNELSPTNTRLVAVSKTKSIEEMMPLYEQGQRDFGENRVQELVDKQAAMPKDINWHFIGHLQSKKVKYIAEIVHLIHAVDSFKLLQAINKQAEKHQRTIDCLLQFKIAKEASKYGLDWESAATMLPSEAFTGLKNIRIVGVMGMATFTSDQDQVRSEFQQLKQYFDQLKANYFQEQAHFKEISMGMSGDYAIAIEEGSTMVRIGSLLFGPRIY